MEVMSLLPGEWAAPALSLLDQSACGIKTGTLYPFLNLKEPTPKNLRMSMALTILTTLACKRMFPVMLDNLWVRLVVHRVIGWRKLDRGGSSSRGSRWNSTNWPYEPDGSPNPHSNICIFSLPSLLPSVDTESRARENKHTWIPSSFGHYTSVDSFCFQLWFWATDHRHTGIEGVLDGSHRR